MISYKEKLKDPRWQKKRREILERDGYQCTDCHTKKELQVHHNYLTGREGPWDYPDFFLITLCKSCHQEVHKKNAT